MAYKFLSAEWIDAAKKIREEAPAEQRKASAPLKMNLNITDVPFGDSQVAAHVDTTGGELEMDLEHIDGADVTATLDYDTAKKMMVDSDPQAAMQAFMAGKIKLQGDMTKAMSMQASPPDPAITAKIQEITE